MLHLPSLHGLIHRSPRTRQRRQPAPRQRATRFKPMLELLEDRLAPAIVTWDGGGGDCNWNNRFNWDMDTLPGQTDHARILLPVACTSVGHTSGMTDIQKLTSQVELDLSGGTFTLNTAADTSTTTALQLRGMSTTALDGPGRLDITDRVTWSGGTMTGTGETRIGSGARLDITASVFFSQRTLTNLGTINWNAGRIAAGKGATLVNEPGGTLDIRLSGDADFSTTSILGGTATIRNRGTMRKSTGTGTVTIGSVVNFENTGSLQVLAGTLRLVGGTHTVSGPVNGSGVLAFGSGAIATVAGVAGSYALTGQTIIDGGSVSFNSAASTGTLTLSSGTLAGTGTLTVSGLLTWTGGGMAGTGSTVATGGMDLSGPDGKSLSGRTLSHGGTATWTGAGSITLANGAVLRTQSGAVFDAQNNSSLIVGFGSVSPPTFENLGTFRKSIGTGTTTFETGIAFDNRGAVDVQTGTLQLRGGGRSSGTFALAAETSLVFSSNPGVTFRFETVEPPLAVTGPGTVRLVSGTLEVTRDVTFPNLTMSGGVLTGAGNLTITGPLTWTGGNMTGAGQTTANGFLAITANGQMLDGRTLNVNGGAELTGTGVITTANGAKINNDRLFDVRSDADLDDITVAPGTPAVFNNQRFGVLRKSNSTGRTFIDLRYQDNVIMTLAPGKLEVLSGELSLRGGGTINRDFPVAAGATLEFGGGTFGVTGDYLVSGTLRVSAGTVVFTTTGFADTLELAGGTTTFNRIAVARILNVSGGTGIFNEGASIVTLNLSGGTFDVQRSMFIPGLLTWTGGRMTGPGQTDALGGLVMSGPGNMDLDARILNNRAMATWSGGTLRGFNRALFNNVPGATLEAQSGSFYSADAAPSLFNNAGRLRKTTSGTLALGNLFNNDGTADVQGGVLAVGPGSSNGSFIVPAAAVLEFGDHNLYAASSVTGAGTVHFSFGTTSVAGAYDIMGMTQIERPAGPSSYPVALFLGNARTLDARLGNYGTLGGVGALTVTRTFTWTCSVLEPNRMDGTGNTNIAPGAMLNITGSCAKRHYQRTINNYGTTTWTGGAILAAYGATFHNHPGGFFIAQNDAAYVLNDFGRDPLFLNDGTFIKSGGTGTTRFCNPDLTSRIGMTFTNGPTGSVKVLSGRLAVACRFTNFDSPTGTLTGGSYEVHGILEFWEAHIRTNAATIVLDGAGSRIVDQTDADGLRNFTTNTAAGSFTLRNGRSLSTTPVGGPFTNAGSLTLTPADMPPMTGGYFLVEGDYTQTATGILNVGIGGPGIVTQYYLLAVTGTARLAGRLNISLLGGYVPNPGDVFLPLLCGTRNGMFDTISGLTISPTRALFPLYFDQGLLLYTYAP